MNLSIVTVCFNAEKVIEKTIKSVLEQKTPVYEYIIVDGASTDRTCEIATSYAEAFKAKGICFKFSSEPDRGISDAFNKGIKQAEGDYIGLINADDELMPDMSFLLAEHTKENPTDVVYGNCLWVDEQNHFTYIKKPKHDLDRLYYDLVLIHPSTFVRKDAYEKYGMFNVEYRLCMDKELLCRMHVNGASFSYLDHTLALFRAGGVSDRNALKTILEGIKLSNTYHMPKYITYSNALKKLLKHQISKYFKKTPLYKFYLKFSKSH